MAQAPDPGVSFPARRTARDRLRQLAGPAGGGLESGGVDNGISDSRRAFALERLREELHKRVVENPQTTLDREDAGRFIEAAEEGLARLAADGPTADLSDAHQFGLEAIIETDGSRPSAPIRNGWIDTDDPRLGDWKNDLLIFRAEILKAIAATARIVVDGNLSDRSVNGTAVMIAPGLAATAKHVVEQTFEEHGGQWMMPFGREITLDFHVEDGSDPRPGERVRIKGVKLASPDRIGRRLDLANLDLAVIELEAEGPPPVPIAGDLTFPRGRNLIHVIGHPKRVRDAAETPRDSFEEILNLIFGDAFGVKRWSPGEVRIGPGTIPEDLETRHVMTHDASTLPGNSGSPTFDLASRADRLMGLHYGGFFEKENYAHAGRPFADWLKAAIAGAGP